MRDILPEEQSYFSLLSRVFESACAQSGFQKIYTPTIEPSALFERTIGKSTDIVEKELYTLKSRSGKSLALRPEGTASIVRAYIENGMISLPQPVKLFYQLPMFRYDRPQAGRYREHWQFGVEAIGDSSPLIDVTVIALAVRVLQQAGLSGISLQINSIGCPECRPKYKKALIKYLKDKEKSLCSDCKKRLKNNPLRVLDCKNKSCHEVALDSPQTVNNLCNVCHKHLKVILEHLDEIEILYEINPRLVRGLDYYVQTVFEIWKEGDDGHGSLGGGGRYDGLAEAVGGRKAPGVGFGLGADRVVSLMRDQDISVPSGPLVDVFVIQLGKEAVKKCFKLIHELQNIGVSAEGLLDKPSMSSQLKMANKLNVPFCLIIGQKEAFDDTVILKDMASGCQEIYPQNKVAKEVQKRIARITR